MEVKSIPYFLHLYNTFVPLFVNFTSWRKKTTLIFYKDYFYDLFNELPEKVKGKIDEVLYILVVLQRIPVKFLSHITGYDGLYEVRIAYGSNIYRIFCCFDEGNLIVLFNGFQKKSQKTPQEEIVKALKIKAEYFEEKNKQNKNEKK